MYTKKVYSMNIFQLINQTEEFDWDEGNRLKNWRKHKVNYLEIEEVFFNKPLLLNEDIAHSDKEKRFQCLGKTNQDRKLFISFTVRKNKIRVISARDQSQKERRVYEKSEENS
jgi:uncharacterized protein